MYGKVKYPIKLKDWTLYLSRGQYRKEFYLGKIGWLHNGLIKSVFSPSSLVSPSGHQFWQCA